MEAPMPSNPLLDQLRPNHLPEPVGLWPPAMGWWILAVIVMALLVLVTGYAWRRWQKNRYRSEALQQAKRIQADYQDHQSVHRLAHDSNELLKRVALHGFPGHSVAALTGASWSRFLADTSGIPEFLNHSAFNNDRYNPETSLDSGHIYELTRRWIKKHHA